METVARNVAGGIARGLSDANGGGAARGKRDVSGEVRARRRNRRRDRRRDRRRAGILPVDFSSKRARASDRRVVDGRRKATKPTSVGRRSGAPERRRRVSWMILLEVSLTNRRFVTRDFKPTEEKIKIHRAESDGCANGRFRRTLSVPTKRRDREARTTRSDDGGVNNLFSRARLASSSRGRRSTRPPSDEAEDASRLASSSVVSASDADRFSWG